MSIISRDVALPGDGTLSVNTNFVCDMKKLKHSGVDEKTKILKKNILISEVKFLGTLFTG